MDNSTLSLDDQSDRFAKFFLSAAAYPDKQGKKPILKSRVLVFFKW